MSEKRQIAESLKIYRTAKKAAHSLGISTRTLLRRAHAYGLKVPSRGRPRKTLGSGVLFVTHEQQEERERKFWARKSAEARFNAVEEIRNATYALYHDRKLPTLERVYRITNALPR